VAEVVRGVHPGDLIVTLGAGSVSQLGEKILERLKG
jgi:UDP-N-acetylmuramate-alanine ligase